MEITKRQQDIIDLLENQEYLTADKIAKKLLVSEKTVRNDIAQINDACPLPLILSLKGKGYKLEKQLSVRPSKVAFDTGEGRKRSILLYFLSHSDADYYDLAEHFYISESTLERDMLTLNKRLRKRFPHTELKRRSNKLCLEGKEENLRGVFAYYLQKELEEHRFDFTCVEDVFQFCYIMKVKALVLNFLRNQNLVLKDAEIISLMLYCSVALERISMGYGLQDNVILGSDDEGQEKNSQRRCGNETDNDLGKLLCVLLEKAFHVNFKQEEQVFIGSLLGHGLDMEASENKRRKEYETFLKEVLKEIYQKYNIDLREDDVFIQSLLSHLVELHYRAETRQYIDNPLISDIKDTYPLIYDISVYLGMKIQNHFGIQMYEDEIGYISLHIVSTVNRGHSRRKQIAIINPNGAAISRFIENVLRWYFNESIEIMGTYSLFQSDVLIRKKPDLIISTVTLGVDFQCPVFQVSNLISYEELQKIKQLLASQDFSKLEARLGLLYQFDNRLFFPLLSFTKREEVIRFLCTQLEQQGYCGKDYVDYVMEREAIASTSFGNYVAIPHPVEMAAYKNGIAVATLGNDVIWGENKVRVVFLFSLASCSLNLTLFYDALAKSLNDINKMKQIILHVDFNSFMEAFLD